MSNRTLKYDANSIKVLNPRESIRENLGMYIGNADSSGMHQLLIEGIANSLDEAAAGFCSVIEVYIDQDKNSATIFDVGRGIPFGKTADGSDAIVNATCSLHGGGKFEGSEGYKSSLGLHGLGLKCIHYLSSKFKIESWRDGNRCILEFDEKDRQIGPTVSKITDNVMTHGTCITFIPDATIFKGVKWDIELIAQKIQTYALLNNNVKFNIYYDGVDKAGVKWNGIYKRYCYKNGIQDLLKIKVGGAKMVTNPVFFQTDVENAAGQHAEFEFGLVYVDKGSEQEYCYANGGETPNGGTYLTGFKSGYTSLINKLAKANGIDKSFSGEMIRSGLVLVMIMRADFRLGFAEQTKLTLNSPEARGLASQAISKLTFNDKDLKLILKKIEAEQKIADAAARKREAQEKITKGGKSLNSLRDLPEKLADASDFTDAEIFFCEGDSAAGGAKEAKLQNQAILPLRGKIKNSASIGLDEVIKSDTVSSILNCLGCGVGDHFNINNLRYQRIIFMADSDADGAHIDLLLTTLFLFHLPELIKAGKVYKAVSPVYKVKTARGEIIYLYSEQDAQKWFRTHSGFKALHIKGLGEMASEELFETTMNPAKRRLIQLKTEDFERTLDLYTTLMGDKPSLRRAFIAANKLTSITDIFGDDNFDDAVVA